MANTFAAENGGIDLRKDKMAAQRLKDAAEKAKIELSGVMSTAISLPFITADATGPKHLEMTLTRAKFNELTADLVEATMGPVRQAISDSGLRINEIDKEFKALIDSVTADMVDGFDQNKVGELMREKQELQKKLQEIRFYLLHQLEQKGHNHFQHHTLKEKQHLTSRDLLK